MNFKGLYFLWLPEGLKAKKILGLRRDLLKNHEDYFNKYPAELPIKVFCAAVVCEYPA